MVQFRVFDLLVAALFILPALAAPLPEMAENIQRRQLADNELDARGPFSIEALPFKKLPVEDAFGSELKKAANIQRRQLADNELDTRSPISAKSFLEVVWKKVEKKVGKKPKWL